MNAIHTTKVINYLRKQKLVVLLEHKNNLFYPLTFISVSVNHILKQLSAEMSVQPSCVNISKAAN
jgi:hypothetical protein